jgi:hypothetical protein
MNYPSRSRLEDFLSSTYPVGEGFQYAKQTSINSVAKIGYMCNNAYLSWLSNPRNEIEAQDELQSELQDARYLMSDSRTGVIATSAAAVSIHQ